MSLELSTAFPASRRTPRSGDSSNPRVSRLRRCFLSLKSDKKRSSGRHAPRLPCLPVRPPPMRDIVAIATAYAREKHDASLICLSLPERIDALLPVELALQFDHDLWDIIGSAANRAVSGVDAQSVARGTLLAAVNAVVRSLEGLETRLHARGAFASNGDVVQLDGTSRKQILDGFLDELTEIALDAMPHIARISTEAAGVRDHAKRQLRWVRERWEAVFFCKTQLTHIYNDNEFVFKHRKVEFLNEAVQLLTRRVDVLPASSALEVARFFTETVMECPVDVKQRVVSGLCSLLYTRGCGHTWIRVATQVISVVADHAAEREAVVRLQAFWRGCAVRSRRKPRNATAHELLRMRTLIMEIDPTLLAQCLLRQALALTSQLPQPPHSLGLVQLQRCCAGLGEINLEEMCGDTLLAFWLNVRNLTAVLALLLVSAPRASPEAWCDVLRAGMLFVGQRLYCTHDIDNFIFQAGPLPRQRTSSWRVPPELKHSELFVACGLWLPVRFGLPALRVYRPEMVRAQLRLNAEGLISECVEAAGSKSISLPPVIRDLGAKAWLPLVRGRFHAIEEANQVNWSFDPRRFVLGGVKESEAACL